MRHVETDELDITVELEINKHLIGVGTVSKIFIFMRVVVDIIVDLEDQSDSRMVNVINYDCENLKRHHYGLIADCTDLKQITVKP